MGALVMSMPRLGDASTPGQINQGVIAAGGLVSAAASAGLLATVGITAAVVPVIGPIVAGITLLVSSLGIGQGCGTTCTITTGIVNKAEPFLQQNVSAAQSQAQANGGCLTLAEQQTLLANFDTVWQQVQAACQQVGGPGGSNCVADRRPGGKYDWTSYYRTPIMQIPVCPQSVGVSGEVAGASAGGLLLPALLIGAALLLGSN